MMSALRKYWVLLSAGLIVIIAVGSIAWFSGCVAKTGTLGDTLGGIFSPLIGLFSAVLIYETFKAQREQLNDQRSANAYSKSSFFYGELKQLYEHAQGYINRFSFRTKHTQGDDHTGINAIDAFVDNYRLGPRQAINGSGLQLIRAVLAQLKLTLSIAQRATDSRGLLVDNELQLLMQDYLQGLINNYVQNYEPLFDVVRARLIHLREEGIADHKTNSEPNELIAHFQTYYKVMESFEGFGYVKKYRPENINSEEYFDKSLDKVLEILDLNSNFVFSELRRTVV